ncbi:MAG: glycosyltransferase family 39 protein [Candidatus Pacebacteria bacterium]|nr:glycosyltransferase family 39 protein [Candidatus Paceibacterota bacterium]
MKRLIKIIFRQSQDEKGKTLKIILGSLTLLGIFFRFSNLKWGGGFFFHPDENNIARSVSQLTWPGLHPHFFAYGHFSLYLTYALNQILAVFLKKLPFPFSVPFPLAVYTLRFLSAGESVLTIFLTFLVSQEIFDRRTGILAACLTSLTPGLIQAAHFGTTESLLTLLLLTSLYSALKILKKPTPAVFGFSALILGISLATKISALVFFCLPLTALIFALKFPFKKNRGQKKWLFWLSGSFIAALTLAFIFSPYQILDWSEFIRIARYEIKIARGKISVFYTRQFKNTLPFFFQLRHIFPFALNPVFELIGLSSLILILARVVFSLKRRLLKKEILLLAAFMIWFIPNSLVFTKWVRFVTPILPFFAIFAAHGISFLQRKISLKAGNWLLVLLVTVNLTVVIAFFKIYQKEDIRITAGRWINENLPSRIQILSESGNVTNLPLTGSSKVTHIDFYDLDQNQAEFDRLLTELTQSQYLLIPSRRVFKSHPRELYPKTGCYYQLLFSGQLGFAKIKEFNSFPSFNLGLRQIKFPDENAEETWSVFDHPVIRLYEKKQFLSQETYRQLFRICFKEKSLTIPTIWN